MNTHKYFESEAKFQPSIQYIRFGALVVITILSGCGWDSCQHSHTLEDATACYKTEADGGNAIAQNELGNRYYMGKGTPQNFSKAIEYFKKAAEQDEKRAQHNLAKAYANGDGLKKDMQQAVFWYQKAVEHNYAASQVNLGIIYLNGNGVHKDVAEAVRLFQLASSQYDEDAADNEDNIDATQYLKSAQIQLSRELAAKGDTNEQYALAERYLNADGVPEDETKAVQLLKQAAVKGHLEAERRLGNAYSLGVGGVSKNIKKAEQWWLKSANSGNIASQLLLAEKYSEGEMLTKNMSKSVYWYQQVAAQGNVDAQAKVASLYAAGSGVKKDLTLAYAWSNLAASNGNPQMVEERDSYANQLSSEEKIDSQRISAKWTKGIVLVH